jgi:hypothetical protein
MDWLDLPRNRWLVKYELLVGKKIALNYLCTDHYPLNLGSFLSLYTSVVSLK